MGPARSIVGIAVLGVVTMQLVGLQPAAPPPSIPATQNAGAAAVEDEADFPGPQPHAWGWVSGLRDAQEGPVDVRVTDPPAVGEPAACHIQSETSVAADGRYVYVGFNDGRDCMDLVSTDFTGFARSTDGGKTFEDLGPLEGNDAVTQLFGDPVLALDTSGAGAGTLYLASLSDTGLAVGASRDRGKTFRWFPAGSQTDGFADKEWLAIDNSGGGNDGNLYLAWWQIGGQNAGLKFMRSTDGARSWGDPLTLSTGTSTGVRVAVGPSGEVHVVWEGLDAPRAIFHAVSRDGGKTFSEPTQVASVTPTGHLQVCVFPRRVLNGDIRTQEFPSIAVDGFGSSRRSDPDYNPYRGTVYVAFARDGADLDESDVYMSYLAPGAKRWAKAVKVNDDETTTDQFFPEITATGPGTFAMAWTDRRDDALPAPVGNRKMVQYVAFGSAGGRKISPNRRFSDMPFPPPFTNPNTDPLIASCYAGDYNALVSDGRHIYAAWADQRDDLLVESGPAPVIPDPNVYFRKVRVP